MGQLLTENALLALIGTALGLLLAQIGIDAIKLLTPANVPNLEHVAVERNVVWFTVAVGAFTILLFGLVPALRSRSLYVARLTPDGRGVSSVEQLFENKYGRLRDVLVGPDGAV